MPVLATGCGEDETPVRKPLSSALLALCLIGAACASDGADVASAERDVDRQLPATTVAPTRVTATTAPPTTTTTAGPAPTTTTTTAPDEEPEVVGGAGVDHDVFVESLAPLVVAEQAMHDFEADWDAGMTYSDTFRGWREVKAIVSDALDGFSFPDESSAEQLTAGAHYITAIQAPMTSGRP